MKLKVSVIKPGRGELASVEVHDPEPGDVASVIGDLLVAARGAVAGDIWPIQIDIREAK